MVEKTFNFIVNGGEATGGPPIGPALGPLGVNIMSVVATINEMTSEYKGVPVPVDVTIDTDSKEHKVKVGMLSTFALITQAIGITKGSPTPNTEYVGNLTFEQVMNIAHRKRDGILASTLKSAVKEIVGSCQSMGVTVDDHPAMEVQSLIVAGEYDSVLTEAA
jgi:large subunit ribosomal protein L11